MSDVDRDRAAATDGGGQARHGMIDRFLSLIEHVGNRLPDQATIFVILALLTLMGSWWAAAAQLSIQHPVTKEMITVTNLLTREGLQWVFGSVVTNFTGFAPLGTVLVAMIGVGVAERTGLFTALLKALVRSVPAKLVTPTIVFAGIMSNVASDAGYVILPPLAAMLYASLGRHPIAGIAAAFAGVAGGFSANLLLSTLDPMLAGLTETAARLYDSKYTVNAACNYYFMAASVALLVVAGWLVSVRFVEPRLGPWRPQLSGAGDADSAELAPLSTEERRGLIAAGIALAVTVAAILALVLPQNGVLRDLKTGGIDPFYKSLVPLILIVFLVPGVAYGIVTRHVRSDKDASRMMGQTIGTMGGYIVMAFFAAQFIEWFKKSNLGLIIALEGAAFLQSIHLTGVPLLVGFVALTALINLLISSASAKWAILAPIFVPMLMVLGKSPEVTQALYRVGDSVTNTITPLNVYFPILIAYMHRYDAKAGMGTLIACMVPYSVVFFLVWVVFVVGWGMLGAPLGPDSPLLYTPAR
ncbi:MAG: AbgT family transporter [Phycisphaerae bacterium]